MEESRANRVTIVDIKMPFGSMVVFMVKWVLASIPAFFVLTLIGTAVFAVLGAFFGRGMH